MEYCFKYLAKLFEYKSILVYGYISEDELKLFTDFSNEITVVDENVPNLLTLKNIFKNVIYENSLYFVENKFDYIINLSEFAIQPELYLKDNGIFCRIININTDEDYQNVLLSNDYKKFKYIKRVNFYNKNITFAVENYENITITAENILITTPNNIIEFFSNSDLKLINEYYDK